MGAFDMFHYSPSLWAPSHVLLSSLPSNSNTGLLPTITFFLTVSDLNLIIKISIFHIRTYTFTFYSTFFRNLQLQCFKFNLFSSLSFFFFSSRSFHNGTTRITIFERLIIEYHYYRYFLFAMHVQLLFDSSNIIDF